MSLNVSGAKELADFGDDEYPNMVCLEAGHVSSPVILLPGTAFEASQILQVMWDKWAAHVIHKQLIFLGNDFTKTVMACAVTHYQINQMLINLENTHLFTFLQSFINSNQKEWESLQN